MDSFATFLLQIAVFIHGGLAIHTLGLMFPDNTYEPSWPKFFLFVALGILSSMWSFSGKKEAYGTHQ